MGDSWRPPPPPPSRRGNEHDTYRPQPAREHSHGFQFRGAADRQQDQPRSDFTFQAQHTGGPPPRFHAEQPPPRGPANRRGPNKKRDRGAGSRPQRGGGSFRRRPAHSRDILKRTDRETTPEQLEGMNAEGHMRYADAESSSEDDDDNSDDDESEEEGGSRKRAKVEPDEEPARPKWSNPDPYSVLPPTDLGIGPKKDIVQTIRKAKVEASAQDAGANSIKENADFISFDFGDEGANDDDEMNEDEEDGEIGAPPPPPPGFVLPSDQELAAMYTGDAGGGKRKRGAQQAESTGYISDEWQSNHTDPTPWLKPDSHFMSNVGLHLHREIVDFYDYVSPHRHEERIRSELMGRLQNVIEKWPPASSERVVIRSFGSYAAGLYLPTADMDLVAVSARYEQGGRGVFCQAKNQLYRLRDHLNRFNIPQHNTIIVIAKAKVPIIKFVDEQTGIKVDISFENDSGLRANNTFKKWKEQFPEMPVLVMIIKQFLAMRNMNEVHTGGLGGFSIICLVVSMLQMMPENQRRNPDMQSRYGELLLNFFDLYGNKFDLQRTGIKMNPPGYFNKQQIGACQAKINPTGLTIIDPNRPENDISGGSRQVQVIFRYFRGALHAIQRQLHQVRTSGKSGPQSILGCILAGNYTSFKQQRDLLDRIDRDMHARQPPSPRLSSQPQSHYPAPQPYSPYGHDPWRDVAQRSAPQPAQPGRGQQYHASHNAYAFQQPPPVPQPQSQYNQQYHQYGAPTHALPARPAPFAANGGPTNQPSNPYDYPSYPAPSPQTHFYPQMQMYGAVQTPASADEVSPPPPPTDFPPVIHRFQPKRPKKKSR